MIPQPSLVWAVARRLLLIAAAACTLGAQQPRYSIARQAAGGAGSPEVAVIRDEAGGLEAAVAPAEGGELTSLRVRFRGAWVELIHRAGQKQCDGLPGQGDVPVAGDGRAVPSGDDAGEFL